MVVLDAAVGLEKLNLSNDGHKEVEVFVRSPLWVLLQDLKHGLLIVDKEGLLTAKSGSTTSFNGTLLDWLPLLFSCCL